MTAESFGDLGSFILKMNPTFERYTYSASHDNTECQEVSFPNGYGAVVIRGDKTLGGDRGRFELHFTDAGGRTVRLPGSSGPRGNLKLRDVTKILTWLSDLPPCDAGKPRRWGRKYR